MNYNSNSLTSLLPPEVCERSDQHLGFHLSTLTVVYQTSRRKGKLGGRAQTSGGRRLVKELELQFILGKYSHNSIILVPSLLPHRRLTRFQRPCPVYQHKQYIHYLQIKRNECEPTQRMQLCLEENVDNISLSQTEHSVYSQQMAE